MLEHLSIQKYFSLPHVLKGAKMGAAVAILINRYLRKINRKKCCNFHSVVTGAGAEKARAFLTTKIFCLV